ncbi:Protein cps3 [Phlyctema vagabunda]|uniref:Protein cps3 n=1 Tax=Phlyctema vagabunda TaxID=108571 RepID=A0ABR4PRZ9_9HELO
MGISVGPIAPGHLNLGGRVPPDPYRGQASNLTNSFIGANGVSPAPYNQQYPPFPGQEDGFRAHQQSIDIAVPIIDTSYASHSGSNYGSPRDEELSRFGLGLSPGGGKGLSVLDAPLPASFDSNGISWIARHGPMASSVPSKFGLESPPPSLGEVREGRTSEALKNLHSSAFGDDTRDRFNGIASSPPAPPADEYFGKRVMHSQRYPTRTKMMSASLPKAVDKDWDAEFPYEEDYLPETLRDLMTPQEKARRGSRTATDDEGRPMHSGAGTPDVTSKFGSPSNASPSRWGPLFQRQQKEDEEKSRISAFGHVGSPLRNSSLHSGFSAASSQRAISRPATSASGDSSPFISSPPRQSSQSSMSMIAQELSRTRISARSDSSNGKPGLHPVSAARTSSNAIGRGVAERQLSSSSIGTGRFTTPIDEEQAEFLFNMEEDENQSKRNSGGWTYSGGTKSPNLGPIGNGNRSGPGSHSTNGGSSEEAFGTR